MMGKGYEFTLVQREEILHYHQKLVPSGEHITTDAFFPPNFTK
jgi:hypothetical protein